VFYSVLFILFVYLFVYLFVCLFLFLFFFYGFNLTYEHNNYNMFFSFREYMNGYSFHSEGIYE